MLTPPPMDIVWLLRHFKSFLFVSPLSCCQAKSKGFHSKYDLGVKYAEKQQRYFAPEKLREGRNIIGLQVRKDEAVLPTSCTCHGFNSQPTLLSFCVFRWAPTSSPAKRAWPPTVRDAIFTMPRLPWIPQWTSPPSAYKWAPTRGPVRWGREKTPPYFTICWFSFVKKKQLILIADYSPD